MNRRDMLKAGVAAGVLGLTPRLASAQADKFKYRITARELTA